MKFVSVYGRVLKLLGPEWQLATLLVLGNLAIACVGFLEPILFGRVVDVLATSGQRSADENWTETVDLLGIWCAVGLFSIISSILVSLHADRLAHRRRLAALSIYFEHVLGLPVAFHQREHSGRMLKVMLTGVDHLFWLWLALFREHLSTIVAIAVLMPVAFFINWKMAILVLGLLIIFSSVNAVVINKTWRAQRLVEDYNSELAARASDALSNIILIQSFVRLALEAQEMSSVIKKLLSAQYPVLNLWALATVLSRMASTITVIGIFILGSWLHFQGEISVGEIVSFMGFTTMLIGRLEQAISFISNLFYQVPGITDFFEVLDTEPTVYDKVSARSFERVRGEVEFKNVSHSYCGERAAVSNLSFVARAGTSVALVGPTGSGKSTTLALLSRLWEPQEGIIQIDGCDIRDVTLESLRNNIGVVFQDSAVFNRSIADNIRIGRPGATQAEIEHAARQAQAHEFILQQPQGYNTLVGERGVSLSGGERQRLAIARTLLKNPPILILDEATSSLDNATEARVQEALQLLMHKRTTFIIAHRLTTIRRADLILLLRRGEIVERGTYDELIVHGKFFPQLVNGQMMN